MNDWKNWALSLAVLGCVSFGVLALEYRKESKDLRGYIELVLYPTLEDYKERCGPSNWLDRYR